LTFIENKNKEYQTCLTGGPVTIIFFYKIICGGAGTMTILKLVLARRQYKKRNRKVMISDDGIFLGIVMGFV